MEIPQAIIDDLILTLHQAQRSTVLIGGTSGQTASDVSLHNQSRRHRQQQKAIATAISTVLEFASEDVQTRLASSYRKSASLPTPPES
ncbi:MAG: hypothetical protein VKI82_04500 [Leptolyngbya sp.]|nr:hypothetical protein [Leptolyngbya sp.]